MAVAIFKSNDRYYSHRYRRDIWFPVWVVVVDGKPIVGDCDNGYTTLRAAKSAARKHTSEKVVVKGIAAV